MKVQIVQLEPQDDLASVSDKLAWAQAPRVLLVWPDRARVLHRRLDLVLLARAAAARGIQIGIVTRDPVALDQAAAVGIPIFRSSTRLPEEGWGPPPSRPGKLPDRPSPRSPIVAPPTATAHPLPRGLRIALAALVVAAMLGATIILLPSATLSLSPVRTDAAYELLLNLDPRAEIPQATGILPAHQVTQTVSGSIRVTTTGTTKVPSQVAAGNVTFTNQTEEPVLIPSGTGVLPSGRPELRFETVGDASLEAGRGAAVEARVVAARPGSAGNLTSGSLNAIDGPLGLKASVTQPESLTGGGEADRPAVAAADQANAERLLTEQLLAQAAADLQAGLSPDEALAEASVRVVNTEQRSFDRPVGDAGDSVGLELRLEIAGLSYRPSQLEAAVELMLAERQGNGVRLVPNSRRLTRIAGDPAHPDVLQVDVEDQTYTPQDFEQVRQRARGRSRAEASASLAELEGLASLPVVTLRPAWWPVLPWLDVRLEVIYTWEAR